MKTEKKQKVVMAVTNDLVTDQRVHKVCTALINKEYKVLLIGRRLKYSQTIGSLPYKTKRIRLLFNKGILFYACFNIRLFFILLFQKADIFTANDLDTLLPFYLVSKIRNKKLVYDSHEYFTEVPELQNNAFARKVWLRMEQYIFPKLTHVSTVCQSIADIYSKSYNVPVSVIRNVPFMKPPIQTSIPKEYAGKPIIIYQGAVNIGRGLELMLDVMKHIDNAVFLIIGGGDIVPALKQSIEKHALQEKVILLGRKPFSELHALTCMAHCGISLEENIGKNYYYALPNKIFDYIHAEIPFVVSDLPEMRRICETYKIGSIAKNRNPEHIAQIINQLIQTPIDKKAYSIARNDLSWENEVKKLYELYEFK